MDLEEVVAEDGGEYGKAAGDEECDQDGEGFRVEVPVEPGTQRAGQGVDGKMVDVQAVAIAAEEA